MDALAPAELRPKSARRAVRDILRGHSHRAEPAGLDAQTVERLQQLRFSGLSRWCVLYLKDGKEQQSAWFLSLADCRRAFEILSAKHGHQAIIFRD